MKHVLAITAIAVIAACGSTPAPEHNAAPSSGPAAAAFTDTLPQPATLENVSTTPGTVEMSLVASPAKLELLSGKTTTAWAYNGSVPGPTIVATEGDHVVVHFTNKLPESTTIHWHGLHVPSAQDGNPSDPVKPGASRDYVFDIPEGSAGTYWYHPHPDMRTAYQVTHGLFGAFIVLAKNDPVPQGILDELIVLQDNKFTGSAIADDTMNDMMNGREGNVLFVNGVVNPTMTLRPGEIRRLRVLNASAARYYKLNVPGHQLMKIGSSGGLFSTPQTADSFLVAPAERAEFLLAATADPGTTTTLKALSYDRGYMTSNGAPAPSKEVDLMTIAYTEDAPMTPPALPGSFRDIMPLDLTTASSRTFVLSERMMTYMINGRSYNSARVDVQAKMGDTEIWTVRNAATMDHPFHVHGFQFQVLERNGVPEPVLAWNDTVNVPRRTSLRLAVKLDMPGMRMFHCHILEHEDMGMMGMMDIE
jgi:bilirubin oxidase